MRIAFLVSVVLLLALVCTASASIVIHDGQAGIVAMRDWDVLDSSGHVWSVTGDGVWTRTPQYDPPMPVSQIKFWDAQSLLTTDNVAWRAASGGWVNLGTWPASAVPENGPSNAPARAVPNPAEGSCHVAFQTASTGTVSVQVFDATGRMVRHIHNGILPAGEFSLSWDGLESDGTPAPSGVYFAKVAALAGETSVKLTLAR